MRHLAHSELAYLIKKKMRSGRPPCRPSTPCRSAWQLWCVLHKSTHFGLLFGAVERKDLLMWQFLVDVFGSPDRVPFYALPARCGVLLVDYVD